MQDIFNVFEERKQEINDYFNFLESVSEPQAMLTTPNGNIAPILDAIPKILRSNAILMLYNLIEYTFSAALEEIFKTIRRLNVPFDELTNSIKIVVLDALKKKHEKAQTKDIIALITQINSDITKFHPTYETLFSGNVDAKELKEYAKKYGFLTDTNVAKTHNGNDLREIREKRKALAHGEQSFSEVAKEEPLETLKERRDRVFAYIEAILENIRNFINSEGYKRNT